MISIYAKYNNLKKLFEFVFFNAKNKTSQLKSSDVQKTSKIEK